MSGTLLFKIAAECNLRCTYCYWFADSNVGTKPAVVSTSVARMFARRLAEYLRTLSAASPFHVSLHGGEPTLIGKRAFARVCALIREAEERAGKPVTISCQTNGTLIDEEWVSIFRLFRVNAGVSIDGPQPIHDAMRIGARGRGSFQEAVRGFKRLQDGGLDPSILAVWIAQSDADEISRFFVESLGATWFDVLIPDATFDDPPQDFSTFYARLFDLWLDELAGRGVTVRICEALARVMLGLHSGMESVGLGGVRTASVNSRGELELLDVLNIAGTGLARTPYDIFTTNLATFFDSAEYKQQSTLSRTLCEQCQRCEFSRQCGGGYLPSRWSSRNGFDNPSAHCSSLLRLYQHVRGRITSSLAELMNDPGENAENARTGQTA